MFRRNPFSLFSGLRTRKWRSSQWVKSSALSTATGFSTNFQKAYLKILPTQGIRIEFLDAFLQDCGGRKGVEGLTTRDVCEKVVLPATKATRSSFCEYVQSLMPQHPGIAPANTYVSHLWDSPFLTVYDSLKMLDPKSVIWMDLFSINHHRQSILTTATTSLQALEALDTMMKTQIQNVIFLIPNESLSNPSLPFPMFQKTWNLLEFYLAWKQKKDISLLSPNLVDTINLAVHPQLLEQFISSIAIERSHTNHPDDKQLILSFLQQRAGGSLPSLQSQLSKATQYALATHLKSFYKYLKHVQSPIQLDVLKGFLNLYQTVAEDVISAGEILTVVEEGIAFSTQYLGPDHTFTIELFQNAAILCLKLERLEEAEDWYLRYLAQAERVYPQLSTHSSRQSLPNSTASRPPNSSSTSTPASKKAQLEMMITAYYGLGRLYETLAVGQGKQQLSHSQQNYRQKAIQIMKFGFEQSSRLLGEHAPMTIYSLLTYVKTLERFATETSTTTTPTTNSKDPSGGYYQEIEEILSKNLQQIFLSITDKDENQVELLISALKSLAVAYNYNQKPLPAIETLQQLLPLQRQRYQRLLTTSTEEAVIVKTKEQLVDTLYGLCTLYQKQQLLTNESRDIMEEYLSLHPPNPADRLPVIYQLGVVYDHLKYYAEKQQLFSQSLSDFMTFYGDTSPMFYSVLLQLIPLHLRNQEWLQAYLYACQCYLLQQNLPIEQQQEAFLVLHLQQILQCLRNIAPKELASHTASLPSTPPTNTIPPVDSLSDEACQNLRWDQLTYYLDQFYHLRMKQRQYQEAYQLRREYLTIHWTQKHYSLAEQALQENLTLLTLLSQEFPHQKEFFQRERFQVEAGIAMIAGEKGDSTTLESLLLDIITRATATFGIEDILTIHLRNQLGMYYLTRWKYEPGMIMLKKNLDLLLLHHPQDITTVRTVLLALVNTYSRWQLWKDRDLLLNKCYTYYLSKFGKEHEFVKQLLELMRVYNHSNRNSSHK